MEISEKDTMTFGTPGPDTTNIDYKQTSEGFDIVENGVIVFHVVTHEDLRTKPLIMQIGAMGVACDSLRDEIVKKIQGDLFLSAMSNPHGHPEGQ